MFCIYENPLGVDSEGGFLGAFFQEEPCADLSCKRPVDGGQRRLNAACLDSAEVLHQSQVSLGI